MEYKKLIELAIDARDNMTYTPYSHFNVGCAVEMEDGSVYSGGNIEIASYSPTNCAERTAIFKAVSEGKREIKKINPIYNCTKTVRYLGIDLTKEVKNIYSENYTTPMKKVEGNTTKSKNIPW